MAVQKKDTLREHIASDGRKVVSPECRIWAKPRGQLILL